MMQRGFTMIEVVLAIAIGAALAVAVYSCTISSAAAARQQSARAKQDSDLQSLQRVLNDDLLGWMKSAPPIRTNVLPSPSEVLVSFTTTSDPIGGGLNYGVQRVCQVTYLSRAVLDRHELVRMETTGKDTQEIVLRASRVPLRMQFFDGKRWTQQWERAERPAAVRLRLSEGEIFISVRL